MDLDKLAVVVRPRGQWQAADLGCLMARRWWWPLTVAWLVTAAPVWLVAVVLLGDHPFWASLLLWWGKPAYERLPQLVLGGRVFGEDAHPWRLLTGSWRKLLTGLAPALTVARLVPDRSFVAPVALLEGQRGAAAGARRAALRPTASGTATWLTVLGVHFEAFIGIALVLVALLLVPVQLDVDYLSIVTQDQRAWVAVSLAVQLVSMGLVAPFYVAGGFSLYLNRRVMLEAWDVELSFRRVARRAAGLAAGLALCVVVLAPPELRAEARMDDRVQSRATIEEVLAGEDFVRRESVRYPKFLDGVFESGDGAPAEIPPWWSGLGSVLGFVTEVLLWLAVLGAAVWLAGRARGWTRPELPRPPGARGLDVTRVFSRPVSAPSDPLADARTLWARGQSRDAIAVLYRGALLRLAAGWGCSFRVGATEGECVAESRRHAPEAIAGYFDTLANAWRALAYAHRLPDDTAFGRLCDGWAEAFGLDAPAAGGAR